MVLKRKQSKCKNLKQNLHKQVVGRKSKKIKFVGFTVLKTVCLYYFELYFC